ncbi:MAG: amidohydrolase family protein [Fuerstiella sp.]|nr:amidohydrolase family protein [Fuerstiella sp.]
MIIDSHQHFWQLNQPFDYGWLHEPQHHRICRDYLPSDLKPHLDCLGIDRTIVVQTQHNPEETKWALRLAEENDFIAGVVGWINLRDESCEDKLLELTDHPKFVGIRHIVQDESDDDFIVRPEFLHGLRVLEKHRVPYDVLTRARHLRHVVRLGRELPNLPLVIDHLSKPMVRDGLIDNWASEIKAAAQFPNVFCKLSGLVTEADWDKWKPSDLKPYVETALEAFGPKRCMFGSDWPVLELAANYEQVHQSLVDVLGPITNSEQKQIFGTTSQIFYGIGI